QRTIIDKTEDTPVAPNQTAEGPLTGYCLDYGKQAPPATILGALNTEGVLVASLGPDAILSSLPQGSKVKYTVDDNPAKYAPILRIIQSGNDLAAQGKFHKDMPLDRYKQAVIQRAIWTYTSRGTASPHTRDTLLADIRKQVKESGGTQSDADINELVNHLSEDINAVLKAAGVQ
ncbi:MAG TPA: Cys-Gln thioester bond-forming surface protein, partial [Candidatus Acidoferrum sp.]|nr:Cys-Gln thioester bond-forming surface protein [Candidatus Acidoferrum sp.]